MIWWSERDGWGHYYLYAADGTLKNQVDKGEFVAEDISYVDEKSARRCTSRRPAAKMAKIPTSCTSTAPTWMAAA